MDKAAISCLNDALLHVAPSDPAFVGIFKGSFDHVQRRPSFFQGVLLWHFDGIDTCHDLTYLDLSPRSSNIIHVMRHHDQELMRYFFGSDVAEEPDGEDIPTMAAFRALGLDPDREPEALKVRQGGFGWRLRGTGPSLCQEDLLVTADEHLIDSPVAAYETRGIFSTPGGRLLDECWIFLCAGFS